MMHKKSQALKWFDIIASTLILVIVASVLMYNSFHKVQSVENKITEIETNMGGGDDLITLLNQPVYFDFDSDSSVERAIVADLLDYSYENNNYREFEKAIRKFFSLKYNTPSMGWSLRIYDSQDNLIKGFKERSGSISSKPMTTLLFPVKDKTKPIKLVFFAEK